MNCHGNKPEEDSETAQDFKSRILSNLSGGFVTMGVALGSRLGLFDIMSHAKKPMTSQEIADAAGYKERYVREWLGLVCTSKIVSLDVTGKKYFLPEHRQDTLTNPSDVGVFSWILPMLAAVEDDVAECFKLTGPRGVPDSKYPLFQTWREKNIRASQRWSTLKNSFELVPGLVQKLEQGIEMVDMGSGMGGLPLSVAKQFPKSKIWGFDISEEAIGVAKAKAEEHGIPNAHFKVQDICSLPADWRDKFDFICMYDVAHDVPYTSKMFKEVLRVLKPGGYFLMEDIDMHTEVKDNLDEPMGPTMYGISLYHCMTTSLATEGSEGWGLAWGREAALGLLKDTGFTDIQVPVGLTAICKKSD